MPTLAQRALMSRLNQSVHGVAITVTTPGGDPVETTGIWHEEGAVLGPHAYERRAELQMMGRRPRVICIPRTEVSAVRQGDAIQAPDRNDGVMRDWVVDSTERADSFQVWAVVVPA